MLLTKTTDGTKIYRIYYVESNGWIPLSPIDKIDLIYYTEKNQLNMCHQKSVSIMY